MSAEVVEISPITSFHSQLLVFLTTLLKLATDHQDIGTVFSAPYIMKCDEETLLMPDLQVVLRANKINITPEYLNGPADIAIEIIPFGSNPDDRLQNLEDYERAGVKEYWLLDPEHKIAQFYQRNADNKFQLARIGASGIFRSKMMPDMWMKVSWFWENPPLKAVVIIREWRLITSK
jgi:Uma2 family endonuclease